MQSLIPLIFIGAFIYLIFARKGGVGCCGGHGSHESRPHQDSHSGWKSSHHRQEDVIDLREDEYTVLPSKNHRLR